MTHFLRCTIRPVLFFVILVFFFPYGTPAFIAGEKEINNLTEDLVKWGGYGEEKLSVVTITGKVDHRCYVLPEHSSTIPVSGATVAIFCGTKESRNSPRFTSHLTDGPTVQVGGEPTPSSKESRNSWVRATTDEYGDFSVELPSHLHAIPNLEKVCFANLLHLPDNSLCSRHQITRKQMIKEIKLLSVEDGVRSYEADTMHLEPRSAKPC